MNPDCEATIKSAANELGISEVEVHGLIRDAIARGLDPEHTACVHMDFEQITELHNRISFALRMSGLRGAALDQACAAAFTEAARAIEHERAIEWKRAKTMGLVK